MASLKHPSRQTNEIDWTDPLNKGLVCWIRPKHLHAVGGTGGDPNAELVQRDGALVDVTSDVSFVASEIGQVWDKPANHYLIIRSPLPELNGEELTWGGWIRPQSTGATYWANNYDLGGASTEHIIQTNGSQVSLYFRHFGFLDGGSLTFTLGEWHLFNGVINTRDQFIKLFINGKLIKTGSITGTNPIAMGSQNWAIGASAAAPSQRTQKGQVGDHRWYNRALSDSEIMDLYVASRNNYPTQFRRRSFPVLFPAEEPAFKNWYAGQARKHRIIGSGVHG